MLLSALIDTQTNEFDDSGQHVEDGVRYVRVPVTRNPDPRVEKYSGNAGAPFQAKTAGEIAATTSAALDVVAASQFPVVLQALTAALYKDAHGSFPNASQKNQLKADFITAWKALLP